MTQRIKKLRYDTSFIQSCIDDGTINDVLQKILKDFDNIFELVRQHNMELYGAVGTRTIRNKKYELKKKLIKFRDTGVYNDMIKTFVGNWNDIMCEKSYKEEEIGEYEEYEEIYLDITKHHSFDNVVFCSGIINDIVGKIVGTSCNQDDYTKLYSDVKRMEKQMVKANTIMTRANSRLQKYSKFVELEMGEFIKYKDRDGTERLGEKVTNSFRKGGNSHIKLRVMGKIEKHIEIDRMIL